MGIDATTSAFVLAVLAGAGTVIKLWFRRQSKKDELDAATSGKLKELEMENVRLKEQLKFLKQGKSRGRQKAV